LPPKAHPYNVSSLFTAFFMDLPEPLLTFQLYDEFLSVVEIKDPERQWQKLQVPTAYFYFVLIRIHTVSVSCGLNRAEHWRKP
jgi:hypothetical protein